MPAVKTYTRVNFQNYPSTSTPLNATNLNKLDKGIDDLDDEVVTVKNAIENMSFDADSISYDNTSSGLQATDVQDAVDEINDNLNGFKFYPTGTQLVAYIEGHGWYNADGKYVIWGTATANALVEASPNTYYGRPSEEDTRGEVGADTASPFSKKKVLNYQHTAFQAGYGSTATAFNISVTKDIKEIYVMFNCARHNTMNCGALAFSGSAYSSNNIVSSKSASGNTYIVSYVYKVLTNGTNGTVTVKLNGGTVDAYTFAIGAFY